MQWCPQTETQSVYQHGISVRDHIFELITFLKTGQIDHQNWKLPEWIFTYQNNLLSNLLPEDIIEEYTIFHDCSKPYCLQYDNEGKRHFPNHAELSYAKWLEVGGSQQVALLMKMDMDIHILKCDNIEEFCQRPEAITLLLAGLAELHSNCKMFGGMNSISFKIKWKHINKMGNKICQKLFGEKQ